ncbi:MAG TPA: 7TM diverse intracellular signaling domain-containing protein [Bacteroidia bacterium]|nr:7TM diverse intracellular signaling domain-containing protein [Bacteroidia bacterium]
MYKTLVLNILLFFSPLLSVGQEIRIKLKDDFHNSFKITYELYYLTDTSSSMSFAEAQESNQFKLHQQSITPNLGFTSNNYWFKFIITNTQAKQSRVLEFAYPFFNRLDVYIPNIQGIYNKTTVGDHFPFAVRPFKHKNFLFDLSFESGETKIIYAYLHCNGEATSFPIKVWTKHDYLRNNYEEHLALGIYYGIALFVFFFSAFLWFIVRERYQLYYFLYIIGVAIFQFSLDGLAFEYLWPNNVWFANHVIPLSGSFTILALILFAISLLKTKIHTPIIHKILIALMAIDVVFFIMSFIPNPSYSIALMGLNIIAVPINILILVAAIISYRMGISTAKYFLVAFSLLILGILIALFKNFGILPRVFITEYSIQIGSAIELIMLSLALAENVKYLKLEKEKAQALLLEELKEKSKLQEIANLELEKKVNERTAEIQLQKEVIEEKNNDITASINYALKIQEAILPRDEELKASLNEYFVFYKPRDIISGDFYWFSKRENLIFVAAADCTGHGVPGALMSMLGNSFLNEIVNEYQIYNPAEILDLLRLKVIKTLRQRETNTKDGMDIAICVINTQLKEINYAGAFNPAYITSSKYDSHSSSFDVYENELVPDKKLIILPADRFPVGIVEGQNNDMFTNKVYKYKSGDSLYLFSDGLADQFGGNLGKKFKTKQIKDLLLKVARYDMDFQKLSISDEFESWKGKHEQVDDILMIGIKLT